MPLFSRPRTAGLVAIALPLLPVAVATVAVSVTERAAAQPAASAAASAPAAVAPPPAVASAPPTTIATDAKIRAMALDAALAYAREHQPIAKIARARIAAAKAQAGIAKGQWVPQIGATAQLFGATSNQTTTSYLSDPAVDLPRIGGTPATTTGTWKPYASTLVGGSITQELFDFGRIEAQTAALDAQTEVETFREQADKLDVELAVREAYYAVDGAKEIVAAADAAYDRAKAHRDYAAAGVANKLHAPVELARADADLARYDVGRIRARGGLDLARAVFAAAVGVPDPILDTAGAPPALPTLPTLDKAVADAANRDPALKIALAAEKAQTLTTKAIGAELRPNFYLSGTLSGRAGGAPTAAGVPSGSGFVPIVPNWDVGVVFSWPIVDGVVTARKEASKAKEDVLRSEIELRKMQELALVRRAYFDVKIAEASIPALERALDAAKITYTQTEARFKGGLATSIEVVDAEALLADAEIQIGVARFELARKRAYFGRVVAEGL